MAAAMRSRDKEVHFDVQSSGASVKEKTCTGIVFNPASGRRRLSARQGQGC